MIALGNDWDTILAPEFESPYYKELRLKLIHELNNTIVYPDKFDIYNALRFTPFSDVKCVILGQDPYHEPGQAHGLAFSVKQGVTIPPSLVNIYKELSADLGCTIPSHGYLEKWARQGILLLNTSLTVRKSAANSHAKLGWTQFTDAIIAKLNEKETPVVFMLWGNNAKSKQPLITNPNHLVLTSVHPSPLSASRGFFGCKHFSKCNAFLEQNKLTPIDWQIEE